MQSNIYPQVPGNPRLSSIWRLHLVPSLDSQVLESILDFRMGPIRLFRRENNGLMPSGTSDGLLNGKSGSQFQENCLENKRWIMYDEREDSNGRFLRLCAWIHLMGVFPWLLLRNSEV